MREHDTNDFIRYNQRRIYRHLYPRSSLAGSLGFRDCLRLPHAHSARRRGGAGLRVGVLQPRCATSMGGHARVATATRARGWSAAIEGDRAGGRSAISLGSQFPADSSWSNHLELSVWAAPRMAHGAWRPRTAAQPPSACVHDQRGGAWRTAHSAAAQSATPVGRSVSACLAMWTVRPTSRAPESHSNLFPEPVARRPIRNPHLLVAFFLRLPHNGKRTEGKRAGGQCTLSGKQGGSVRRPRLVHARRCGLT